MGRDLTANLNHLSEAIEKILQSFSQDLVGWQQKINVVWNTVNVIIRAFQNKGLITEEDIKRAADELANEHRNNLQCVKDSASENKRVDISKLTKTPLEVVQGQMANSIRNSDTSVSSSVPSDENN